MIYQQADYPEEGQMGWTSSASAAVLANGSKCVRIVGLY